MEDKSDAVDKIYEELDEDYFQRLTNDYDDTVIRHNNPVKSFTEKSDEKNPLGNHQDPTEVLARLLFYMSEL